VSWGFRWTQLLVSNAQRTTFALEGEWLVSFMRAARRRRGRGEAMGGFRWTQLLVSNAQRTTFALEGEWLVSFMRAARKRRGRGEAMSRFRWTQLLVSNAQRTTFALEGIGRIGRFLQQRHDKPADSASHDCCLRLPQTGYSCRNRPTYNPIPY
jgi:hypothetical protein